MLRQGPLCCQRVFAGRTLGCHANKFPGVRAIASLFRLGLIVNPLAGLGGRVGLKGSDGAAVVREALARGAQPEAAEKAARALHPLRGLALRTLTGAGPLGEESCRAAGLSCEVAADGPWAGDAGDTRRLLAALRTCEAELLLFAGGDGTARLVAEGAGSTPVLGIPAGVKMYSAVFARSPAAAGLAVADYSAAAPALRRRMVADVLDLGEAALREGHAAPRLFGSAVVPASARMQRAKAASGGGEADLDALAVRLAQELKGEALAILGPGSTVMRVKRALGLDGTLLGVDAASGGRLAAKDAAESELLALIARHGRPRIVVGVLGGLGALFGRGNQPLSPAVLRAAGRGSITALSAADKLAMLEKLFLDTGDEALDREFAGYWRVRVAPRREVVMRVVPGTA